MVFSFSVFRLDNPSHRTTGEPAATVSKSEGLLLVLRSPFGGALKLYSQMGCSPTRRGLRPGVGLIVNLLQALLRDVGVKLGCRQAGVTEELLDHPKIGPTIEEVGCVGVTQGMGMRGN